MNTATEISLDSHSFRMTLGTYPDGSPCVLNLCKGHGLILAGRDGAALRGLAAAAALSAATGGSAPLEVVWAGCSPPEEFSGAAESTPCGIDRALGCLESEQRRRYALMQAAGSNNYPFHNALSEKAGGALLPFILLVVEDLPWCLSSCGPTFLDKLCQAAKFGRACGICPVVCSGDAGHAALPSRLKAEIPDRAALRVESRRDSALVLGVLGAESLGEAELLYRNVLEDGSEAALLHFCREGGRE